MALRDLKRLLSPASIAVIGGGAWCEAIISAAEAIGFDGRIVPVHPTKSRIAGLPAYRDPASIPFGIDAAFVGVNRRATLDVIRQLEAMGSGGAICFASGFSEAAEEDASGAGLQAQLLAAAGQMPFLGPNCYGFLNALDRTGIWPDQHGLVPVESGVAILTQSSNIAINLTMQLRGLPIAMVVTCGNQAQLSQAEIANALLDDPRITALGLHIEGFGDLRAWEALAARANARGIAMVALKSGRSAQAQAAAVSHTASLTGGDAGADALMERLGIARLSTLPGFLEALKIAHLHGRLSGSRLGSISCSGGEAALAADIGHGRNVSFPALTEAQKNGLREALGPMVALANPLDYHTYIWRDEAAMTRAWAALADPQIDLILIILDYPRADRCDAADWNIATRAAIAAQRATGARYAVCSTLPELLPEKIAAELMSAGVLPLAGLDHAVEAIEAMGVTLRPLAPPLALPGAERRAELLTEAEAKAALAAHGLQVPRGVHASRHSAADAAASLNGPVAVKVMGLAHKTEANGLALGLCGTEEIEVALTELADGPLWIEEMVKEPVAEFLIGITRDPAHGFLLTIAAGGTLTELLDDRASTLIPAPRAALRDKLIALKMAPLLRGYRGQPAADESAILDAIEAIQSYALDNLETLEEVEVNPLVATPTAAVAADALIRKAPT
ncbi:MAG: acetate--CoA ligase family protein [Pseudomonadota bacterium]